MRTVGRTLAVAGGLALLIAVAGVGSAASDNTTPAFSGGASAGGVRLSVTIPGFPATDTPVDGGGPTAQVVVDSIGTSQAYAAFPDPGQFVTSVPGLVVGLLSGGAAGLPPINLPSPPNYPLFVASDAAGNPEASVGAGPLALTATSKTGSSQASASAGFQSGLTGNAALVLSTASVAPTDDGGVRAEAVTDIQGLTIGPLTIGEIKSSATETIDGSGSVTPTQNLAIAAVRIGGISVELTPNGLDLGGPTIPVAVNSTLAGLLKAAGISVQFVAPEQFAGKVVSPAVQVSFPFTTPDIPDVGSFRGTASLIIGAATAEMHGVTGSSGSGPPAAASVTGSTGGGLSPASPGPGLESSAPSATGTAPEPQAAAPATETVTTGPTTPGSQPVSPGQHVGLVAASAIGSPKGFDIQSLYLIVVLGALAASAAGALIRRMGVRT